MGNKINTNDVSSSLKGTRKMKLKNNPILDNLMYTNEDRSAEKQTLGSTLSKSAPTVTHYPAHLSWALTCSVIRCLRLSAPHRQAL